MPKIDFKTAKPRIVEAYLREQIRKLWGDEIENGSSVTSSHGYFDVSIRVGGNEAYRFENFRKINTPRILKALRFLAGGGEI